MISGRVVTACDLVGEYEEQEIIERHLLFIGEHQTLWESVGDASELDAFERDDMEFPRFR